MAEKKNDFEKLFKINVNEHVEKKKNGNTELSYLSWAWAWAEIKKVHPDAQYTIYRNPDNGLPYVFDEKTGYMCFTSMTIDGITHDMWLPVMDSTNRAMKSQPYEWKTQYKSGTVKAATMTDINKTIMRCLTKNIAMFGLGLYLYAGEDLPESEADAEQPAPQQEVFTPVAGEPLTDKQKSKVMELLTDAPAACGELFNKVLDHYKVENYTQLDQIQANTLIHRLEKERKKANEQS